MKVTVATLTDKVFTLDVSEDLEIEESLEVAETRVASSDNNGGGGGKRISK